MPSDLAAPDPGTFLREQVAQRAARRIEMLRSQIAKLEAELDDRLAAEATVELRLEGEDGGVWYLNLRGGEMSVADRPEFPPLVRLHQRRADWEALAGGAPGLPSGGGDLTRSRIERLRGLEGAIEFRLEVDEGERRVVVQFGQGEPPPPRCTVRLKAETARTLRAGELTPQAAFMQGLVRLEGDVAFAMQVGAALLL
jgi:putative sterol carrier protein